MSEQPFNPVEWITTREAAEMTGYTRHNLTRAARSGALNSIMRGNMRFFKKSDILEYVEQMKALGKAKHIPKIYQKDRLH